VTSVLVCTALDIEARGLARRLGLARFSTSPMSRYRGDVLDLVCVGLGAATLTAVAGATRRLSLVISAGTCGALAPGLAEGDLVVPREVTNGSGGALTTDPLPGLAASGQLLTLGDAVETATAKARLWRETGAVAVDMESAAVLRWAKERQLKAAVLRAVSDTAAGGVPRELARAVAADGRVRPAAAVRAMLASPLLFRRAMALRRGTNAALDSVAAALARVARDLARS
jgi:adenosylhomocysteine nucleosidase